MARGVARYSKEEMKRFIDNLGKRLRFFCGRAIRIYGSLDQYHFSIGQIFILFEIYVFNSCLRLSMLAVNLHLWVPTFVCARGSHCDVARST